MTVGGRQEGRGQAGHGSASSRNARRQWVRKARTVTVRASYAINMAQTVDVREAHPRLCSLCPPPNPGKLLLNPLVSSIC